MPLAVPVFMADTIAVAITGDVISSPPTLLPEVLSGESCTSGDSTVRRKKGVYCAGRVGEVGEGVECERVSWVGPKRSGGVVRGDKGTVVEKKPSKLNSTALSEAWC